MFTSAKRKVISNARGLLGASVFCLIFALVYERYSHGVYSAYMMLAFLIPLLMGAAPMWIAGRTASTAAGLPGKTAINLWNAGLAALTVGCVFKGALEIYGTTNRLIVVYPIAAAILLAGGLAFYVAQSAAEDASEIN